MTHKEKFEVLKKIAKALGKSVLRGISIPCRLLPWNFPVGEPSDKPVELTWLIGKQHEE